MTRKHTPNDLSTRMKANPMSTRMRRLVATLAAATLTTASAIAAGPAIAAPAENAEAAAPLLMPYYTELDLTGDARVTSDDLAVAAAHLGVKPGDSQWDAVAVIDLDGDSVITIADLAELSHRIVYDDGVFELLEASVIDMQAAMNAGTITSVELTQAYLDRIAAYDRTVMQTNGRPLSSIITISDAALDTAAAADAIRARDGMTSMLLGVPITVKDNYNTADMPTTAGCGCWDNNQTDSDAFMIEGLRADGAVIFAKASLDEFSGTWTSAFSSFQPAGTSTFVASPYNTAYTAGGSSGGSAAAVAANLAGLALGTDTQGSIRVPASYNQLVGIRPTLGLTSRDGIVPLALSQDTGGPLARSVLDAAVALDSVVGVDPEDPATATQVGLVPSSYTSYLDPNALEGARLGYYSSLVSVNPATRRIWDETVVKLEAQGAEVVEIPIDPELDTLLLDLSGGTMEMKHDLKIYVDKYLAPEVPARTLGQIVESGRFVAAREARYVTREAVTEEQYQGWAGPSGSHTLVMAGTKAKVSAAFDDLNLDAIIHPTANLYSAEESVTKIGPFSGLPSVTVPMGQALENEAIPGANVNLELLGPAFSEGPLLGLAYSFEQHTHARTSPVSYPALIE